MELTIQLFDVFFESSNHVKIDVHSFYAYLQKLEPICDVA